MQQLLNRYFVFSYPNNLFLITGLIVTFFTFLSNWEKIEKDRFLYLITMVFYSLSFSLVITARGWFIFMLGWEIVTLTTAILLSWDDKNIAWEYFVIQFVGGTFLILTVLTAYTNGYQYLGPISEKWLQLMFIFALGIKSALIGFHIWIPYVYKKASAGFCAVSSGWVAKLGYITMLKLISDGSRVLIYLGTIMIFYGAIKALAEKNYKLILAFSSISQFGFITLAIGSGNIYGYTGAVIHIIAHALAKSTLFNGTASWFKEFNSYSIFDFKECELRQIINTAASFLSFLSLMAFPFFLGYNSKHLIKYSLGSIPAFKLLLHLGSILTVTYSIKVLWIIFFKDFKRPDFSLKENINANYKLNWLENISLIIPAFSLIILAFTANLYLKDQFSFHYLEGITTTIIYLSVAYLLRASIMDRIEDNYLNNIQEED